MTAANPTGRLRIDSILGLWRDVRVQRALFQLVFAVTVAVFGYVLIDNLTNALDEIGLEAMPFIDVSGSFPFVHFQMDFLDQRAGFGIGETSFGLDYSANNSYGDAFIVGLANMLQIALIGIALATVVGVVAGVSRLSNNWLVSRIATVYVETFRNVPVVVQLTFWYTAVILKLPKITEDVSVFNVILISNRSVAMPWAATESGFRLWLLLLAVAVGAAAGVRWYRSRREDATGAQSYPWIWAAATFAAIALIAYFATGSPLDFNRPTLGERAYIGGLQFTPEFTALLLGLTLYTGAFIAEVVRGSIQAIEKGQTEASAALGLSSLQSLRLVILPQAMRIMIPPLTNQYLNLAKNSSLGVAVAFPDLFRITKITINQSGQAVPMILLVMVAYLTISLVTSLIMNTINARLKLAGR